MKTYVECICGGEAIAIEVDSYQAFLAFWTRGHDGDHQTRWKEKWRWIKQILQKGHPFTDSVVLDEDRLNRLISALIVARDQVIKRSQAAPPREQDK